MDIQFIKSNRFYAALAICALGILKTYKVLDDSITDPIIYFLFTFIGIRTIDRIGDKVGATK